MTAMMSGTASPHTAPDYRPEVDGLRAIAVVSVILYHAGFGFVGGGFVGVDIFFVISGYLITGIVYREMVAGEFSLLRFYERRARRILPALFVMLAATLVAGWFLLSPGQLKGLSQATVSVVAFVSNHYFLIKTGYFSPTAAELPLLHMWTLSVEEQFYVVLPLLLMLLMRFRPRWIVAAMSLALLLSLVLCLRWEARNPELNFFFAGTRAWELLAGGLLAVVMSRGADPARVPRKLREGLGGAGLAVLIWVIASYGDETPFPGRYAVLPIAATVLVIAFAGRDTAAGRFLSLRPMVAMGLISYSAYLWHQPVLAYMTVWRGVKPEGALLWTGLAMILLASWLSWRYIEQPFRDRRRVGRAAVAGFAVAGTAAFGVLGLTGHFAGGVPSRFTAPQIALAATAEPSPMRAGCHTEGVDFLAPSEACVYFEGAAQWAVFGDSHTVEIGYALAERLQARGEGAVIHLSSSGCIPALTAESTVPGCAAWTRAAVRRLESDPAVRNVVVLYRHAAHLFGSQLGTYPRVPDGSPLFTRTLTPEVAREAYWQSFGEMVRRLRAAGKTVYVLDPVPELGRHVEWHVFAGAAGVDGADRMAAPPMAYHLARNASVLRRLGGLPDDPGIRRIETARAFCTAEACRVGDGEELYFFDDNHPSLGGARRIVDLVIASAEAANLAAAAQ